MWKILIFKNSIKFEVPVKGKLILLIIAQCRTSYKLTEEIYSDKTNILKTSPSWFWTFCGKWEKHYYSGKFKLRKSTPPCMISQEVKFASSQCSVSATNVHHLAKQTHQPNRATPQFPVCILCWHHRIVQLPARSHWSLCCRTGEGGQRAKARELHQKRAVTCISPTTCVFWAEETGGSGLQACAVVHVRTRWAKVKLFCTWFVWVPVRVSAATMNSRCPVNNNDIFCPGQPSPTTEHWKTLVTNQHNGA